jgi:hypothetical protein
MSFNSCSNNDSRSTEKVSQATEDEKIDNISEYINDSEVDEIDKYVDDFYESSWDLEFEQGKGYFPEEGLVPNAETAARIAVALWVPIFGEEQIIIERPYRVRLIEDSIWLVHGTLPENWVGGVAYLKIRKSDAKIINLFHTK